MNDVEWTVLNIISPYLTHFAQFDLFSWNMLLLVLQVSVFDTLLCEIQYKHVFLNLVS